MSERAEIVARLMQQGSQLYEQRDVLGAQHAFAQALALRPDLASARFNLAITCRDTERNGEAKSLLQPLAKDPQFGADSLNNLGILACRDEAWDVAESYFRAAISARHHFPLAHFNLATLLLRLGNFEEGWREHEWRWQTPMFHPLQCPHPQWDGRQMDAALRLHTEQGAGDTFQFVRYMPMIRERCKRVIFVRPERLKCMFPTVGWADEIRSPGEIALDSFQAVLPLLSAPQVFGTRLDNIPADVPYLIPDQRTIDLGPCHVPGAHLKVGIAWGGSPTHSNDAFRSTTLDQFAPLFDVPKVAFYSLQKGPQTGDLQRLGKHAPLVRDLHDMQSDFADTAAIMRQRDLVISVDTTLLTHPPISARHQRPCP